VSSASGGSASERPAHAGRAAGQAATPAPWASGITATSERQVFVRGVALDEAIGRESLPAMLIRLWRGDDASPAEAELLGACLVATLDHGPLSPSALVARTIASTRAAPVAALAGGILSFGEMHGAVVTRGMRLLGSAPAEGSLHDWADAVFEDERAAGRRLPGIGHRWHATDLRAERLLDVSAPFASPRDIEAVRALAARLGRHVGHDVAVNIDGALAVALRGLRLDPEFGDFVFAIGRSFGLAAHIVEERTRERPMRLIDPTSARYDGVPIPDRDPDTLQESDA
jgi:citrate synthase